MESNFFVRSVMRMIGCGSVEPETELLTAYQELLYYLRRIRGRVASGDTKEQHRDNDVCCLMRRNRRREPRPVPAVEAQRTVNSEAPGPLFFLFLFESCRGVCFARWWCVSQRAPVTPRERAMSMF